MNKRQMDLIMSIIREHLEDYLSDSMAAMAEMGIRMDLEENRERIEQLGGGKKTNGKMTDGCLVEIETGEMMRRVFGIGGGKHA